MEAAAVAWACEQHGTPLFCIKVVTDLVDGGGVGEVRERESTKERGRQRERDRQTDRQTIQERKATPLPS